MQNARLDDSQAGIKIAKRNNFRYAYNITLMAESKEKLELLDENEWRKWKSGFKLNIQKTKIMASSPITSWQIEAEKVKAMTDFIFFGSKITVDGDCSHEIKKHLLLAMCFLKKKSYPWTITRPGPTCRAS